MLIQDKSIPVFLLNFPKKLGFLPYFAARRFFASLTIAVFLGLTSAGLVSWKLQIVIKETPPSRPAPFSIDEKKYGRAVKTIELSELSLKNIDPEKYFDIFNN